MIQNLIALVVTFACAIGWLRLNDFMAHRGWIDSRVSRKIIHIGTGPIFVLCWLLFNSDPSARILAALVPLGITAQFLLVGLGVIHDPAAVEAMSRSGDRKEILRGPLYYGIAFVALTLIFWKDSPIGIVGLMVMCGGDGLADVLGQRYGKANLPWSPKKTWVGSIAMAAGAWLLSIIVLSIYLAFHGFPGQFIQYLPGVTLIGVVATMVESLPYPDVDNITVPVVSVLLGLFVL